ncbi:MAG: hypothetical protein ACK4SR_13725 [Thiobacillus sp.]
MLKSLYRYWIIEPLEEIRRWPGGVWTFAGACLILLAIHIATDGGLIFLVVVGALAAGWLLRAGTLVWHFIRWMLFIR